MVATVRQMPTDPFADLSGAQVREMLAAKGWVGLLDDPAGVALDLGELVALRVVGRVGQKALGRLLGHHGELPSTPRFRAMARGTEGEVSTVYVFCRPPQSAHIPNAVNMHGAVEGLSLVTTGRIVIPPSTDGGVGMRWSPDGHPATMRIALAPAWLVDMARDPVQSRRAWEVSAAPKSTSTARTDYGNAERLVRRHGADLRYCAGLGGWLAWDGSRWQRDETGEVVRRAKETVRSIAAEAATTDHEETRRSLLAHALGSEKASRLSAMVQLAQSEAGVPVRVEELDADPWLLNVANGCIDLRTGAFGPSRREALCTRQAPVAFDPDARCPTFDAFLESVQPDPETRACLMRILGYSLTGVVREHIFPIHHGGGGNGKGTLRDVVLAVLGDYATEVPAALLMSKPRETHPTEKMVLRGARFASASETEKGRAIDEPLVKLVTGGDPITARYMNRDFITFLPTHKLWLSTNHKPVIRELSAAMWRRVLLFPWARDIPVEQQDTRLKEKLCAELPGILNRLIAACLEWQRRGVDAPAAVRAATDAYRAESDPLGDFLAQCTTRAPAEGKTLARVMAKELLDAFTAWASANGCEPLTAKSLGDALRGRYEKRPFGGLVSYVGLRLLTPEERREASAHGGDGEDSGDLP
jgi:putative DNA primase/helicase